MDVTMGSFNERVLLLENYSAPLRVLAIDSDSSFNEGFQQCLSQIFLLQQRLVMEHTQWKDIGRKIVDKLKSEEMDSWLVKEKVLEVRGASQDKQWDQIDAQREDITQKVSHLSERSSDFAYLAIRSTLYMASEGSSILPDEYGDEHVKVIPSVMSRYLFNVLVVSAKISQDTFSFWLKTTRLLFQPVSQSFKNEFRGLAAYEVPYGLSPQIKSETLETILSNAKKVAILPLIQGAGEVGSAIASHHWGVALQAATTSGAVVIILLSAITISERIYQWKKSVEKRGPE